MIEIKNLYKSFKNKGLDKLEVLKDLSISITDGDYISIMGTSGVGKTTLLNIIGLVESYDSGSYQFDGKEIKNLSENELAKLRAEKIGYIFQDFLLMDNFSVYDNILVSQLFDSNIKNSEIKDNIEKSLVKSGLDRKILKKKVGLLSGGQKQRVAIARAIANNPSVILADEPTGSIDVDTKEEILKLFDELNKEGITILLITHDPIVANKAKKKYIFNNHSLEEVLGEFKVQTQIV